MPDNSQPPQDNKAQRLVDDIQTVASSRSNPGLTATQKLNAIIDLLHRFLDKI